MSSKQIAAGRNKGAWRDFKRGLGYAAVILLIIAASIAFALFMLLLVLALLAVAVYIAVKVYRRAKKTC